MPGIDKPNIVFVMCDDLGYGDVGFNGSDIIRTPNLDSLAANGIRFNRFMAGGPVCSPTRGTCLTGRHYIRYGINHANEGSLPAEEITVTHIHCRCNKRAHLNSSRGGKQNSCRVNEIHLSIRQ